MKEAPHNADQFNLEQRARMLGVEWLLFPAETHPSGEAEEIKRATIRTLNQTLKIIGSPEEFGALERSHPIRAAVLIALEELSGTSPEQVADDDVFEMAWALLQLSSEESGFGSHLAAVKNRDKCGDVVRKALLYIK